MIARVIKWWSTKWWWLVATLAVLSVVLAVTEGGNNVSRGSASYSNVANCRTAQLSLAMSANHTLAGGRVVTSSLRVTNRGATCALVGDAPMLQPVTGVRSTPVGRGNVSDGVARTPVLLSEGQSASSSISVESLPPHLFRTCHAETVTGLVITDGLPAHTNRYIAHVFHGVCSNPLRDNVGAAWYVATGA